MGPEIREFWDGKHVLELEIDEKHLKGILETQAVQICSYLTSCHVRALLRALRLDATSIHQIWWEMLANLRQRAKVSRIEHLQEWIDRRLQKAVGRPKVLRRAFWALQSLLCESCGRRSPCTREACNSQRCKFIGENKKLWGVDLCCRCGEEYVDINYYQERIQETLRHHRRVQELLSAKQVKELLIWNMDPGIFQNHFFDSKDLNIDWAGSLAHYTLCSLTLRRYWKRMADLEVCLGRLAIELLDARNGHLFRRLEALGFHVLGCKQRKLKDPEHLDQENLTFPQLKFIDWRVTHEISAADRRSRPQTVQRVKGRLVPTTEDPSDVGSSSDEEDFNEPAGDFQHLLSREVSIQLSNVARMIRHAGKVRKGQPEHLPLIEELEERMGRWLRCLQMFLSRVEQMDLVLSFFHRLDPLFKYVTSHSKLTRKDPPDVISLKTVDAFFQAFLGEGVCTSRRKADEVFERLMCRGMSTYLGPGLQHFAMTRAWAQALHEHLLAEASKLKSDSRRSKLLQLAEFSQTRFCSHYGNKRPRDVEAGVACSEIAWRYSTFKLIEIWVGDPEFLIELSKKRADLVMCWLENSGQVRMFYDLVKVLRQLDPFRPRIVERCRVKLRMAIKDWAKELKEAGALRDVPAKKKRNKRQKEQAEPVPPRRRKPKEEMELEIWRRSRYLVPPHTNRGAKKRKKPPEVQVITDSPVKSDGDVVEVVDLEVSPVASEISSAIPLQDGDEPAPLVDVPAASPAALQDLEGRDEFMREVDEDGLPSGWM
ncbi:unnamed protein product [Durusdinium trenchii]|uniref:Uncharacterized protein n=1 Tax=Durusdinium trenchii TaxID=1381693 RepID=A0ABP0JXL5_9DINO